MNKKHKNIVLIVAWTLIVPVFVWQQIEFWRSVKADDNSGPDQSAIEDTKNDISDLQDKIAKEKKAQQKLQQNLGQIQQAVSVAQSEITKTKSTIQQTEQTISKKQQEINNLDQQIQLQTELLKGFIQQMYYIQGKPILSVALTEQDFSDLFSDSDHYGTLADKIRNIAEDIKDEKMRLEEDKVQLADMKEQHEQILDDKLDQKQDLIADQVDTQQSIADKQKTIDKLNKELSQLQGDLSKLLGKSYSAKNIMDAVEFASGKTGVPKGFLIGVLKMETNLGANVGGCTYADVEDGAEANYKKGKLSKTAYNTFLHRREVFKTITDELDLDYRKQKVSCNPSGYAGTGGAMGVAQFMPDTWMGYKSQVTSFTGHNPPSPWDLGDGVMAMALKLGKTPGVTDGKTSAFKTAACSYLGTCYAPYVNGILYWADNYKDLIN